MTRAELLAEARVVLGDTLQPYGWSDARILMWMAEGQDSFCEHTGFWDDMRTYSITTQAGVQSYQIDPRIIEVRDVYNGTSKLHKFVEVERPTLSTSDIQVAQAPVNWQADRETGYITFLEPVDGAYTLTLRVHRRSIYALNHQTTGSYDKDPEIPERCQLGLPAYAKFKALGGDRDRELENSREANAAYAEFMRYVMIGKDLFSRLNNAPPRIAPSSQYVV